MVSAAEALLSKDPKVVKRLRSSSNTQILCNLKVLEKALAPRQNGQFDFKKISPQLVETHKLKLQSHWDIFQKLHEHYVELLEDETDKDLMIKKDIDYIET